MVKHGQTRSLTMVKHGQTRSLTMVDHVLIIVKYTYKGIKPITMVKHVSTMVNDHGQTRFDHGQNE